jgi:nitrate reductase molybdenum cofactor assembly chaperone
MSTQEYVGLDARPSCPYVGGEPALPGLSPLFEYPDELLVGNVFYWQMRLAPRCAAASAELGPFLAWLLSADPGEVEETYVRTFLVTPVCAPYASVHLFGEESFRRAELMAGLRSTYARVGLAEGRELPDHVALLLRLTGRVDGEELDDLVGYCLRPALVSMARRLEPTENPYRHALRAIVKLLEWGGEPEAL